MGWDWLSDFIDWWTTQRVAAGAAVIASGAAVTAAISGVRTFRQSRRDSKGRNRPMVAAELREVPYVKGTQILVVRNYGPSIARDVRVTFEPEIPDPDDASISVTPFLKRRYAKPVPVLTPGMELDNVYFSGAQEGGSWVNREPTPEQVTVTIAYENDTGDRFVDEFPLDTNLIRNRTYSESSGSPEAQMKMLARSVKTLADLAVRGERCRAQEAAQKRAAEATDVGAVSDLPTGEPAGHRALVDRLLRRNTTP